MPKETQRYFIARGRSLEAYQTLNDEYVAAVEKGRALAARVGAETFIYGFSISGFLFAGDAPPDGWREVPRTNAGGRTAFAPPRRKAADKRLWSEMQETRIPDGHRLVTLLGGGEAVLNDPLRGGIWRTPGAETIGGEIVLSIPIDAQGDAYHPPDAEPIPASRYWAMKEAAEEEGR